MTDPAPRLGASGDVAAVILAAGGGTRFAGAAHKLVTPFRGRSLVWWSVEHTLAAGLAQTVVVSGAVGLHPGVEVPDGATVVENPRWREGQATSLQTALTRCAGRTAVVVGLGDQPLIPATSWVTVAAAVRHERPIVVATYDGRRRNPVALHRRVWGLLPAAGDAGARGLMAERPDLVTEVACAGEPADIDTVEDLSQWS